MDWYDGGHSGAGWLMFGLMMLSFWALVILGGLAVYALFKHSDGTNRPGRAEGSEQPSSAERLLDERFARGEIDADEYRQRRELLRSESRR